MSNNADSMIDDLVGTLTDPIIVYPGGWGDTLPEWLKNSIVLERLTENMKETKGEQPTGTDAEACAYLNTASLTVPMDNDWAQIYLYVAGKSYRRWGKGEFPTDIAVNSISDYQTGKLNRLKDWIYQRRVTARKDRDKVERRTEKEEAETQQKLGQPALFEF
jgi:hypothetical protein